MLMRTHSTRNRGQKAAAAAALAVLLVGSGAAPASAQSTREQQWFLDAMHAEDMWRTSTGEGITVAVIDTGVDPDNPDLKGRVLPGKDLAEKQPGDEHTDYNGHGTGMAGLIAGTGAYDNGKGAYGLAPGAKILPIRMPDLYDDNPFAGPDYVSNAIRYAADSDAQIINISSSSTAHSSEEEAAVKYALDRGSLIFAAAGNSGDKGNPPEYPAATPGVVAVGAVGKDLRRTAWSQYGPQVDMAAPGEDMVHACGGKTGLCKTGGTSDATALASASAALIWSAHPEWTNNQVLRVMLNTIGAPTDGAKRNDSIGYGIVRPRIALTNPGNPGPADVYPLPDFPAASAPPTRSSESSGTGSRGAPQDIDPGMAVPKADDGGVPGLAVGIGISALAGIGIAVTVVVRKRLTTNAPPPAMPESSTGQLPNPTGGFGPAPSMPTSPPPPDRGPRSV